MSWITRFLASALPLSALSQQFPPPSLFSIADIPNLSDKVIMVYALSLSPNLLEIIGLNSWFHRTGGNTGIGYAICSALLKHDATVYLTSRSEERVSTTECSGSDNNVDSSVRRERKRSRSLRVKLETKRFYSNSIRPI